MEGATEQRVAERLTGEGEHEPLPAEREQLVPVPVLALTSQEELQVLRAALEYLMRCEGTTEVYVTPNDVARDIGIKIVPARFGTRVKLV